MTENVFGNRRPNTEKLTLFGFLKQGEGYFYQRALLGGQMELTVTVVGAGEVFTRVIDRATEEEYVLHRVPGAAGSFVGQVRAEYEAVLAEIAAQCFDPAVFGGGLTAQVIAYAQEKYGDVLEFLWQKFPDNAVLRRKDNRKWYAAILTVSRRKLGFDSDERVEIIDLRMRPEEIEKAVDGVRIHPGYHMNKKHWITICLDGSVPPDEVCRRIDESYALARK